MTVVDERVERLQEEVAALQAEVKRLGGEGGTGRTREALTRGQLLRSAGLVAAGAAGAVLAGPAAAPALAANGDNVVAGQTTAATAVTGLTGSVLSDAALRISNYYSGAFDDYSDALQAYTFGAGLAGVYGRNDAAGGAGVIGYSSGGYGASLTGGLAPLRLQPAGSAGAPTSVNHQQGELYVDSAGVLWLCTASGTLSTPGTFQQVATIGAPQVGVQPAPATEVSASNFAMADATDVQPTWSAPAHDPAGFWSTGHPTHLTAPASGFYAVTGFVQWSNNSSGERFAHLRVNGSDYRFSSAQTATANGDTRQTVSGITWMNAGDYVELDLFAFNSGGTQTALSARLGIAEQVTGGGLSLVAQHVTSAGGEASYTLANIPAGYKDLVLDYQARCDNPANQDLLAQFNGDTGAAYFDEVLVVAGSGATAASAYPNAAVTQARIGCVTGTGAPAGSAGAGEVTIPNYAGTTFNKVYRHESFRREGTGTTNQIIIKGTGEWANTSALTSIKVFPGAGSFVQGSTFNLYARM